MKVLLIGKSASGWAERIQAWCEVPLEITVVPSFDPHAVARALPGQEVAVTNRFGADLTPHADSLRLLMAPGAGLDKIDFSALPAGVAVANCYEHESAIAEFVLMQMLVLTRRLLEADRRLRANDWSMWSGMGYPPYGEIRGKVAGVIGMGRIGRAVTTALGCLGVRVRGVDAVEQPGLREQLGLEWFRTLDGLPDLLAHSDYLVMAAPLNEHTRGMIGAAELARMKPTAFLINPARAELIDEDALYRALESKRIAGAALDVWYRYPVDERDAVEPAHLPFAELDNVVMTPHMAGWSEGTMERRYRLVAANLGRFARGEPLANPVPR